MAQAGGEWLFPRHGRAAGASGRWPQRHGGLAPARRTALGAASVADCGACHRARARCAQRGERARSAGAVLGVAFPRIVAGPGLSPDRREPGDARLHRLRPRATDRARPAAADAPRRPGRVCGTARTPAGQPGRCQRTRAQGSPPVRRQRPRAALPRGAAHAARRRRPAALPRGAARRHGRAPGARARRPLAARTRRLVRPEPRGHGAVRCQRPAVAHEPGLRHAGRGGAGGAGRSARRPAAAAGLGRWRRLGAAALGGDRAAAPGLVESRTRRAAAAALGRARLQHCRRAAPLHGGGRRPQRRRRARPGADADRCADGHRGCRPGHLPGFGLGAARPRPAQRAGRLGRARIDRSRHGGGRVAARVREAAARIAPRAARRSALCHQAPRARDAGC